MSIRPAAGCKYFLTIRPALLFCTPNRFISGHGGSPGAQAGFATSRTLGLGFGIDFGFFMTLNTIAIRFKYVITFNIWCVVDWSDG